MSIGSDDLTRRMAMAGIVLGGAGLAADCYGKSGTGAGAVMAVGPFAVVSSGRQVVPGAPRQIRTAAWDHESASRADTGAARYVRAPEVTEAFVRAHPRTSFRAPDEQGRLYGYRLDEPVWTPQMLGARGDGRTMVHPAFLALAGTAANLRLPAGDYLFDNRILRQIDDFRGQVSFAPGARLWFIDQTKTGLYFYGGAPRIDGGMLATRDMPLRRQLDAPLLYLNTCHASVLRGVSVARGAGAGIVIRWSDGLRASNLVVRNVLADGIDLFNCSGFDLSDIVTDGTGDDGVAVLDYLDGPRIRSGSLRNIVVRNSDTRGITMVGPTGVVLDGFRIERTRGSGLLIGEDVSNGLRVPADCRAVNGVIDHAGQREVPGTYSGNRYGIEIAQAGPVELRDIRVVASRTRGVSAAATRSDSRLTTTGLRVEGAGGEGIHVLGLAEWTFDNIVARECDGTGIYAGRIGRMNGGTRTAIRTARGGAPFRAIWDEDNIRQAVVRNVISDDRPHPTGNVYFCRGAGTGTAGQFEWSLTGPFYYDCKAPGIMVAGHVRAGPERGNAASDGVRHLAPGDAVAQRLTVERVVVLPAYGQFPGMRFSVARAQDAGSAAVRFLDPGNGARVVTTLPAGRAGSVALIWDAMATRWRVG